MSAYIENNTLSVLNPISKETIDLFSISSKEDINKAISFYDNMMEIKL